MKNIPPRERLIFAMDVADAQAARRMVETLGDSVAFYKIGLELFMSGEYFELLDWLAGRGKKIFVDLKFFDVPATVAAAVAIKVLIIASVAPITPYCRFIPLCTCRPYTWPNSCAITAASSSSLLASWKSWL